MAIIILGFALFGFIMFIALIGYTLERQKCNKCDYVTTFTKERPYCAKCGSKNIL